MKSLNSKTYSNINICFILFGLASLLYNTVSFRLLGYGAVILAVILSAMTWLYKTNYKMNARLALIVILLIAVYLFAILRNVSFKALETLFSFLISIIVLVVYTYIDIRKVDMKLVRYLIGIILLVLYIPMFLGQNYYNVIDGGYKSIYTTTTFLGIFSCMCVEICYLLYRSVDERKLWLIYMVLFSYLIWISKVRTAIIGLIILCVYVLFHNVVDKDGKGKDIYVFVKWGLYILIIAATLVYPNLDRFAWFNKLQEFIYMATGKILLTGRNIIWREVFDCISASPLFGYGLDFTNVFSKQVHSSYLQIIMQGGILSIFLVWLLINHVLNHILKADRNINKKIFVCSLINMLMCTTEVMLLQGQVILQIIMWGILAVGNNISKNEMAL